MDFIYILLSGPDWDDITVFLTKEHAIDQSKKYPNCRVEIFTKNNNSEYVPTYNYYKNGQYIHVIN